MIALFAALAMLAAEPTPAPQEAPAPELVASLRQRFAGKADWSASFSQEKNLPALSRPLRSSGRLLISRQDGLLWQQEKPFASSVAINAKSLVQRDSRNRRSEIKASDQPMLAAFAGTFAALFAADLKELEKQFTVKAGGKADAWTLELLPKDAEMAKGLRRILVEGGVSIHQVTLEDPAGSLSKIVLSDEKALSPEEAARFGVVRGK